MKLSMDSLILNSCHSVKIHENNVETGGMQVKGSDKKFDEIILTSSSRDIEDKIFTEKLGRQLNNEMIKEKDRAERLAAIKLSVQNGTYEVNSRKIAEHMLFRVGKEDG